MNLSLPIMQAKPVNLGNEWRSAQFRQKIKAVEKTLQFQRATGGKSINSENNGYIKERHQCADVTENRKQFIMYPLRTSIK